VIKIKEKKVLWILSFVSLILAITMVVLSFEIDKFGFYIIAIGGMISSIGLFNYTYNFNRR
jgi:asparagine N-glycosylation enzyme membrane subunit Stt3